MVVVCGSVNVTQVWHCLKLSCVISELMITVVCVSWDKLDSQRSEMLLSLAAVNVLQLNLHAHLLSYFCVAVLAHEKMGHLEGWSLAQVGH